MGKKRKKGNLQQEAQCKPFSVSGAGSLFAESFQCTARSSCAVHRCDRSTPEHGRRVLRPKRDDPSCVVLGEGCENPLRWDEIRMSCFPCFPINVVGFLICSVVIFVMIVPLFKIYELLQFLCCGCNREFELFFLTDQALHTMTIDSPDEEQLRLVTAGDISTIVVKCHAKAGLQEIQCVCAHDGEFTMQDAMERGIQNAAEAQPFTDCFIPSRLQFLFKTCVYGIPELLVYIPNMPHGSVPNRYRTSDGSHEEGGSAPPKDVFMWSNGHCSMWSKGGYEEAAAMIRLAKVEHSKGLGFQCGGDVADGLALPPLESAGGLTKLKF